MRCQVGAACRRPWGAGPGWRRGGRRGGRRGSLSPAPRRAEAQGGRGLDGGSGTRIRADLPPAPAPLFPALLLAAGSGGTRQELAGVKKSQGKRFVTQVWFRLFVLVFSGKLTCGSGVFLPVVCRSRPRSPDGRLFPEQVSVLYFARSAELAGLRCETLSVPRQITALQLWEEIVRLHPR